ncbi:acyl-CoA thioesterase [Halofilum ochraceum]|uniref:acyl-CoA thioesterase n=1 Tax=Halofilum ochraceum TaxID=1611323 RepID=UPI00082D242D|nr:thioesterase family protein [Halofilum ochraceum]
MNLWLRLLLLHLTLKRQSRVDLLEEVVLDLRVWPTDLDIQRHMNNGRYLSVMDLGRYALMARTGLLGVATRQRWMPLVRGLEIEYFKPLMPFQRFRLHTRLAGWDEKWLYLEQRFETDERVCASARIHGLLRGRDGNIAPDRLLQALGEGHRESPRTHDRPCPPVTARATPRMR